MTPHTLRPDDRTERVAVPNESDDGDSSTTEPNEVDAGESNGIPVASEGADSAITPMPPAVVAAPEMEPTQQLAKMTLRQKYAVLWLLETAAARAGVPLEVELMPADNPTGVHILSSDWVRFSVWLREMHARHWRGVRFDLAVAAELYDSARFLLDSLARTVPQMRNRVIEAGPVSYIYVPVRED
jgi:hypothetical protein